LPFAEGYFDAVLSFDAYHCFGTNDLYLGYLSKFVRPRGRLALAVPGLARELLEGPPETLRPYWEWEFCSSRPARVANTVKSTNEICFFASEALAEGPR
jgi:hypothetical protein